MPPKRTTSLRSKLKVVKIPLTYVPPIHAPDFPPMPRLYLELLENKNKVKPELRSKEYIPPQISDSSFPSLEEAVSKIDENNVMTTQKEEQKSPKLPENVQEDKKIKSKIDKKGARSTHNKPLEIIDLSRMNPEQIAKMNITISENKKSSSIESYKTGDNEPPAVAPSNSLKNNPVSTNSLSLDNINSSREKPAAVKQIISEEQSLHNEKEESFHPQENKSEKTLHDLLSGKDPQLKTGTRNDPLPPMVKNQTKDVLAPSLAEITSGNVRGQGMRDMTYGITKAEENELSRKRDLLFKFKILKRTYGNANLPEVNEYTPLKDLEREYDMVVRQLALDATVENYKKYLVILFVIAEFVVGSFFKLEDIKGLTQQQLLGMNQYERLLWLIAEKKQIDTKPWSPELQLLGLVVLNTAIFVGTKMLIRAGGANLMNMINSVSSSPATGVGGISEVRNNQPKPKMKGPDIDISILTGKKTK